MPTIICQKWDESERDDCGVSVRPDGFSLHKTEAERVTFIKEYWANEVPDCYSRPDGEPYFVQLDVLDELHLDLLKSTNGIRKYSKAPEGFRKVQ